jgi:hypothetical protein
MLRKTTISLAATAALTLAAMAPAFAMVPKGGGTAQRRLVSDLWTAHTGEYRQVPILGGKNE